MLAPPPRNELEYELRNEVDAALSGSCSSAVSAPLFTLSESETKFVNCQTGLPISDGDLFKQDEELGKPGTYGEITMLGTSIKLLMDVCCALANQIIHVHRCTSIIPSHGTIQPQRYKYKLSIL